MKRRILDSLRCPTCRGPLELCAFAQLSAAACGSDLVREGVLTCQACEVWYPIENTVPVLLEFPVRLHEEFAAAHRGHPAWPERLSPPHGRPMPGEEWTQRGFTRQWADLEEDALTFSYTHEERRAFLRLETDVLVPIAGPEPRVLDVGCGFGLEGRLLQEVVGGEVFAVDLNLSLLKSGPRYQALAHVHTVVASLYRPPFEPGSFDLVYCHGVAHHTHSTREAFEALLGMKTEPGGIYLWVYAHEDFDRGSLRMRFGHIAEIALRPYIARLPAWLQAFAIHPLAWVHYRSQKKSGPHTDEWRYRNSVHSMRDRWTCRYAHRHSFNEVIAWFREAGLSYRLVDPLVYREAFGYDLIGIGIRGTHKGEI